MSMVLHTRLCLKKIGLKVLEGFSCLSSGENILPVRFIFLVSYSQSTCRFRAIKIGDRPVL